MCCWFGYRYHTLSPHTYIYIAALLHRSSINSVLHSSITTIRESYEPGFAYCTAKLLKFIHSTAISLARLIASTRGTRLIATTRNSTHRKHTRSSTYRDNAELNSSLSSQPITKHCYLYGITRDQKIHQDCRHPDEA
jgi:hypothetical protein